VNCSCSPIRKLNCWLRKSPQAVPPLLGTFASDETLRRLQQITDQEMETLSKVALMGEVRASRDFVFVLNAIRHALGKPLVWPAAMPIGRSVSKRGERGPRRFECLRGVAESATAT
jgi:hypothetical protein